MLGRLVTLRKSERPPPGNRGGQWVHGVIGSAPRLQRDDSRFESGWIHAGSWQEEVRE